jgi:hypothetical protein
MRKLFITLALGVAMRSITSCRWIHETLYSVEGCTEWYLNEFYEAAADDDVKTFLERWDQLQQWKKTLSETDVKKANEAYYNWSDQNEAKDCYIEDWIVRNHIDY